MDLPVKERFRDRQQRLNAEAEARGKKLDEYGRGSGAHALGGDSDDEDTGAAAKMRDEEDEYYDLVAKTTSKKRSDKE
ncbi:hypothetical protein QN361_25255, partial [Pseudomonas sp. 5C2]|nr:hypothetical protein [Pseudomonas sp. 5C2]